MTDNSVTFEADQDPTETTYRINFIAESIGQEVVPTSKAILAAIEACLGDQGLAPIAAQCHANTEPAPYRYQVWKRGDDKWVYRVVASNGQIVSTDGGQGYENKDDAATILQKLFGAVYIELLQVVAEDA